MSATYLVRADFSGTAYGGSPTWTDITDYLLTGDGGAPINISGGRQNWLGDPNPGTCSFTLDNRDGRFTPGNASSPYTPHVKAGVRVRVTVTVASTDVHLFDGYVGAWRVGFNNATYATCQVTAQDILGARWANDLLRSMLAEEMLLDSPTAFYMLQEAEGSVTFADATGNNAPATIVNSKYGAGVIDAGQQPTETWYGGNVVAVTNDAYATWTSSGSTAGSWIATPFMYPGSIGVGTIEFWVGLAGEPPAGTVSLLTLLDSGGSSQLAVQLTASSIKYNDGSTGISTAAPFDGQMHQVVITSTGFGGTAKMYFDGALIGTDSGVLDLLAALTSLELGMDSRSQPSVFVGNPFTGSYAFLGVYPTVLSGTRVLAHYNAGANAFAGELTSDHLARLLSYRTNLGSVLDTGRSEVGSVDITGTSLQAAIVDCVNAEQSNAYIDGQGQLVFKSLDHLYNPAVALTLDASSSQVNGPTAFVDDLQYVVNDVTVTTPTGAAQRVFDQTSIDAIGDIPQQLDLNLVSDAAGLSMAGWILANGVQEQTSSPQVDVDLATEDDDTVALAVLQTAPLDVIELDNLPSAAPASTLSYVMQGWSYQIGSGLFDVSFYTTPVTLQVVEINGDAAHGIDSTAITVPA